MGAISSTELRGMVREVLREVIASKAPQGSAAPVVQQVSIAADADLQAFIAHLASPGVIEKVRSGVLRFRLAGGTPTQNATQSSPPAAARLGGVISERTLKAMAPGTVISLAPDAVLTPLAKDAARRLGLTFERSDR